MCQEAALAPAHVIQSSQEPPQNLQTTSPRLGMSQLKFIGNLFHLQTAPPQPTGHQRSFTPTSSSFFFQTSFHHISQLGWFQQIPLLMLTVPSSSRPAPGLVAS